MTIASLGIDGEIARETCFLVACDVGIKEIRTAVGVGADLFADDSDGARLTRLNGGHFDLEFVDDERMRLGALIFDGEFDGLVDLACEEVGFEFGIVDDDFEGDRRERCACDAATGGQDGEGDKYGDEEGDTGKSHFRRV